jgi:hypothetical protein
VVVVDLQGNFLFFSEAAEKIVGLVRWTYRPTNGPLLTGVISPIK